jgi:thiamine biosynthesis lipoprotein
MTQTPLQVREGRALGSPLRLTLAGGLDARDVDEAWDAVTDEFARVDRAMSRFRPDSELTALHREGGRIGALSWRLERAIVTAERARRVTGGRFDPRVVRALERLGQDAPKQPWGGAIGGEPAAGGPLVRRSTRRAILELDAPVDLGGIGKGLALRWAAARVAAVLGDSRGGVTGFLLEAGGDLVADGTVGAEPWSIGVEDPAGGSTPVAAAGLPAGWAMATSSIRLARWRSRDGTTAHHLIDPRTGQPAFGGLVAVTVAFMDPAWAEVWSKALFVEGAAGIANLARRRGLAAWWVGDDGGLSMTPAARAMTYWVRAEASA